MAKLEKDTAKFLAKHSIAGGFFSAWGYPEFFKWMVYRGKIMELFNPIKMDDEHR